MNNEAFQTLNKGLNMEEVLRTFDIKEESVVTPFGRGLINRTWKVSTANRKFILQCINNAVFRQPAAIAYNIRLIGDYLAKHSPECLFVTPIASDNGDDLVYIEEEGFF